MCILLISMIELADLIIFCLLLLHMYISKSESSKIGQDLETVAILRYERQVHIIKLWSWKQQWRWNFQALVCNPVENIKQQQSRIM